jgi:hypothetical protein
MEGFKEYLVVYAYKNESDSQLDLTVNDIIEVPIGNSQLNVDVPGWIKGKNKRTSVEGYYPGIVYSEFTEIFNLFLHELLYFF